MLETQKEIKKPGNIAILRDWLTKRAAESLLTYTELTYHRYKPNWHHRLIIDYLERIERGDIRRLMILIPPRYGKTELSSIRFPAWYLGRNPHKKVILASHSDEFALPLGKKVRNLIRWPLHSAVFPECRLREDSQAGQFWELEGGGQFISAGRDSGRVMGNGAHILILDDIFRNWEDALSQATRDKVWDWYTGTLYHRLEENAAIVIVNTRWNADDLVGRLLEAEGDKWTVITMPAIAGTDITYGTHLYRAGETLWPDRYSIAEVLDRKKVMGSIKFDPIFQQDPRDEQGNIILREYWQRVRAIPGQVQRIVQSWDTGYKTKDENSYSACTTWAVLPNGYCLIHAWWDKLPFPQLKHKVQDLYYGVPGFPGLRVNEVIIEDKASGQSLVQELREGTKIPVKAIKPEGDKVARAHIVSPVFEGRLIYIMDGQPWTGEVIDICAKFPGVRNKDIVDSITQGIEYMRLLNRPLVYHNAPAHKKGRRPSLFELERQYAMNGGNGR